MAVVPAGAASPGGRATAVVAPRRRYAPARHPGRRWTGDEVLAALCEWTERRGSPPRREDWTGRSAVWRREHPRWPSSSCVAAHHGSWSAALRAAGLPAREQLGRAPAERVAAAHRLAVQGLGLGAIAAELGVSRSTAHNYIRAVPCPDCGGPVVRPGAERCAECTRHEPTVERAWDRAAVRAAIREWREEHGAPPTHRDWTPTREGGSWAAENPRWPSAALVCALYRNWNDALGDAGEPARARRWPDAAVRDALAHFWTRAGRPPARADLAGPDWDGPSERTLRRRYGGVDGAWHALGPVPSNR